jgi:hypothetical protein
MHVAGLYTFDVIVLADLARARASALDLARALGLAIVGAPVDLFFSDQPHDQAFIAKQQRLWKEESDKTDKRGGK